MYLQKELLLVILSRCGTNASQFLFYFFWQKPIFCGRECSLLIKVIVNKCKQASDVRIIQIMDHWMANTPVPATLLLITSDKDSAMALKKVERTGYNTILASDEGNVAQLLEYV